MFMENEQLRIKGYNPDSKPNSPFLKENSASMKKTNSAYDLIKNGQ